MSSRFQRLKEDEMKNHLSIIFLPTNKCNVNCEYCFEDKTDDRLTLTQLEHITNKIFDFLDESNIKSLTLHWQGGEIMTMPPRWFEEAFELIDSLAVARNKLVDHGLQTNMIGYTPRWNNVIQKMFGNAVGTSMDYPNLYRKLFNAGPAEYTRIWTRNISTAREAGIKVGVIAVPNQATLAIGAERFYSFFVDELGVTDFQVNTPFPGGESNTTKQDLALENEKLSRFFVDLADIWVERGRDMGVKLGPIDQLIEYFSGEPSCLPCIWQTNCADEFISIDARGFVAQCDCWVTSYPEYFFGNIFEESLGALLKNSPARKQFLQRPAAILDQGCIECDYLSLCHGGCPVRTYTIRHTLFEKDPYCQLYKSLFRHAEELAAKLAGDRFWPEGAKRLRGLKSLSSNAVLDRDLSWQVGPLVQIERKRNL
jgi:radical SAM protein with 4Fe4S-binding SPASM domain